MQNKSLFEIHDPSTFKLLNIERDEYIEHGSK